MTTYGLFSELVRWHSVTLWSSPPPWLAAAVPAASGTTATVSATAAAARIARPMDVLMPCPCVTVAPGWFGAGLTTGLPAARGPLQDPAGDRDGRGWTPPRVAGGIWPFMGRENLLGRSSSRRAPR